VPARLGRWYQRLIAFDGQAYNDFRAAIGEVVQREFDGAYVGGADAPSELRNWISAAEAAKLLHIRAERLVDAIAKQHLPGKQYLSGFGHSHTMIHRETVTEVAQNRQRFIDKTAARNLLGISQKQYDLFTSSGIFARFVPENLPPLVDGQHDAVELKRFVDDIASNSTALEGQTVALQKLNLRFTTDTSGLTKVYCRIGINRMGGERPFAAGGVNVSFPRWTRLMSAAHAFKHSAADCIPTDLPHRAGPDSARLASGWLKASEVDAGGNSQFCQ
tara:strand:+ start:719 stop:1543 length:825 start_codon:yes stop_codon:yes gene_type:complete